jgi:hypothetical protein
MGPSPALWRRIVILLPPLLVAALLIPFALRQNAWYEWETSYWLLQRQAEHVSAHGVPTFFLHTKDGTFYPFYLFYGGFTISLLAYPAALFGAWPVFLASMVGALVGGYLGIWWTARQLGLSHRLAVLPAVIYTTTPYVLSDAYGRGAWAELVGVNAVPVMLAGWMAVLRPGSTHRGRGWAALAGSAAIIAGTHNVTLLVAAAVLPFLVLALLPVAAPASAARDVARRLGGGLVLSALGVGLTGAWLVPNLWLGTKTYISDRSFSQDELVAAVPFEHVTNVLSPWPTVPRVMRGLMWIYAQAPVLAMAWALAAFVLLLPTRRGGTSRGVVTSSAGLLVVGAALLLLIVDPAWWRHFPRVVQTIQMPMRLIPYLAVTTAVAIAVLVRGLGGPGRARRPVLGALVLVATFQVVAAAYGVTAPEPGAALSATVMRHSDIHVEDEPSPFSGPGETVALQFRVIGQARGRQTAIGGVSSELADNLTSDAATLHGLANVGDQFLTDIVASPLVRIGGDARVAGRTGDGRVLLEVMRTDAQHAWSATVRAQCTLCLSAVADGAGWQLWFGRLLTLLSFVVLLSGCAAALSRRHVARLPAIALKLSPDRRRGSASRSR